MTHARITHPTRGTLEFLQPQSDDDTREAVANVPSEVGNPGPPLVHVETRERSRMLRGTVTGPRRARNDPDTNDFRQALANYVTRLEAHVTEFQGGDGYTFEDDVRGESMPVVYSSVEWSISGGEPYQVDFTAEFDVGQPAMDVRELDYSPPTTQDLGGVAARVGGYDLPGLRDLRVRRSFGVSVNAIYNKSSAANNDIIQNEGERREVTFKGTHTGTKSERATADANLESLIGGGQVALETAFPGYTLDGFVTGYDPSLETRHGGNKHHFELSFMEGRPA